MNYTNLISKKKQYKYSVNICLDLQNDDRLSGFIPNATTTEIIRDFLGGIIRKNAGTHSRILYGSYGTGKSHLLTVICAILGHINTEGDSFASLLSLLASYDNELATDIRNYVEEELPYLIVPVYSDYSDFAKCITFSTKKELNKIGISVCFRGFFDEALELLEKWADGKESAERLEQECAKLNISVANLKKGLSTYDLRYENLFNSLYTGMTYGAIFNSTAGSLIDNMNSANEAIKNQYRGIVLVFDEFGRYIEDYGEKLKIKDIQDLAEYCDHSDYDDHLILVSHKQISIYADGMKKNIGDEWKKVEGRFKPTSINIKYDQCLSLIGQIIPKTDFWKDFKKTYSAELEKLYAQAWNFKGFILPPVRNDINPFEDGFPMHPITLFALDRLSKKVAQNERTFFTYLAGDEEYSLFSQLEKYDIEEFHFIGMDNIYDYFEDNIKTYKTDESYEVYKKLQYALNKLGETESCYMKKVLKILAAINIIAATDSLTADRETLMCVIDGDKQEIAKAIDDLEKKKIIKFMRQYGYYDFFDSSIYDLDEMIDDRISYISNDMVINILNEKFANFVLYPYSYNEHYFVNRVFLTRFGEKEDLNKRSMFNSLPAFYDGIAVFVLDDDVKIDDYLEQEQLQMPSRTLLIINNNANVLREEVKRYVAIQYFYSRKEELAKNDPTVINELKVYLEEQEAIISELIKRWRSMSEEDTIVIINNEVVAISSENNLSEVLSSIMENSFNRTLMVNNDLLNKNSITGVIRLARKKAIESIIKNKDIYEGIQFLSPEYNALRATLSKNGIVSNDSVREENRVEDASINKFSDGVISGEPVMRAINEVLKRTERGYLPVKDLYCLLKSEPYGLRDGYIPILVAYALKPYRNVSFYFHGKELPYTVEELEKALMASEDYTLFASNWNEEELIYIESLEKLFERFLPKGEEPNQLDRLFRAMNAHYSSISKSARSTELYVSNTTKEYRNIMSNSYKDYNTFFFEILPRLNNNLQELPLLIENIKNELDMVEEKIYLRIQQSIKLIIGAKESNDLVETLKSLYESEWRLKSQKAFDYATNGVLDIISQIDGMSERMVVAKLAKTLTGFDIAYWNDEKIKEFEKALQEVVEKLDAYIPDRQLQEGEAKITIESKQGKPIISQFSMGSLSPAAQTMFNKIKKTVDNFGGGVGYEERIAVLAQILKEIIN